MTNQNNGGWQPPAQQGYTQPQGQTAPMQQPAQQYYVAPQTGPPASPPGAHPPAFTQERAALMSGNNPTLPNQQPAAQQWAGQQQPGPTQAQQPGQVVNPFRGVTDAPNNEGGSWIETGTHLLQLGAMKYAWAFSLNSYATIAEFKVIASTNPQHAPGSDCSRVINMSKQSALSNVRRLVAALYAGRGVTFDQVDDPLCNSVVQPEQPAKGVYLICKAREVETRRVNPDWTKGLFTKCSWTYVDPSHAQLVANEITQGRGGQLATVEEQQEQGQQYPAHGQGPQQ